jgi:hypothetical protein
MDLFNLEQFQDNNTTIYYTSQMDLNELHFTYCNCNMYPSSPQHGTKEIFPVEQQLLLAYVVAFVYDGSQNQVYTNEEISLNLYSKKIWEYAVIL